MKNIIGIDFGTSTSMIKTAVRDGKTDTLETKPVTFTQYGISSTPTLIRKKGDAVWYGRDAELNERPDAPLYRNFKLSLRSENPQERQEAVKRLEEFFRYLYLSYAEQQSFLFPGSAEAIETVVSYPAQWSREQQELVINAAKKAGFPNVSGMDEPSAAVNCILKAKQKDIEKAGILYAGKPLNVLVVDMGAGTTDLAFVTVTVKNGKLQTVIRGTWPEAGSHVIYGGSQMDLRLEEMMRTWLSDSGVPETMAQNLVKGQRSNIKSWKESTLSAFLAKDMTADEFSAITNILMMTGMNAKPFPAINRDSFSDLFRPELENFVKVISSVPQNLRDEAELVILTGGNSEWFWIPDVMLGTDTRFGDVDLKNIRSNPDRLIRMEQPAETVSRGLVYDQNMVIVSAPSKQQEPTNPAYTTATDKAADRTVLAQGKCGKYAVWTLYENGEFHIDGVGDLKDYEPKVHLLFAINTPWYKFRDKITTVSISNGIKRIGNRFFQDCHNIVNIMLPESIETIGEAAFLSCVSLKKIWFPQNLKVIGGSAFCKSGLSEIVFTGSCPWISSWAFDGIEKGAIGFFPKNDSSWNSAKNLKEWKKITWIENG